MRALVLDGTARMLVLDASETVAAMLRLHGIRDGAAILAGELALASLLMSAWTKGDERIMLQLQGEEPTCSFSGEADADGHFRGWLRPSRLEEEEAASVRGMLLASKSNGQKEMYRGVTEVKGESLAVALQRHLTQSDQVDVVLKLGRESDRWLGVLVERLPGDEGDFTAAVARIDAMTLADLAAAVEAGQLLDHPIMPLEERPVMWRCRCDRDRVQSMLVSLGSSELEDMAREDDGAEVRCHFCNSLYRFSADELVTLARALDS